MFIVSLVSMYAISDEVYFRKVIQRVRVNIFQYIKYLIFIKINNVFHHIVETILTVSETASFPRRHGHQCPTGDEAGV